MRVCSPQVSEFIQSNQTIMVWNIPGTGSLPLERWHNIIGDTTYAVAILDRVVHKADGLELSGESLHKQSSHAKSNSAK